MALVPFTHANPFTDQLRLPERLFTINDRLIKIKQAWKSGGKGGTTLGFGASVYPAAYVLAEYLERHPHLVQGKRVIELGTGTGFLGIAVAVLGATEVCITDGDQESLQLAQTNVSRNFASAKRAAFGREMESTERESDENFVAGRDRSIGSGGRDAREEDCEATHTPPSDWSRKTDLGGAITGDSKPDMSRATKAALRDLRQGSEECKDGCDRSNCVGSCPQEVPIVTVKRLLWGCTTDMDGVRGPWDVIIGSDITALPYASAHSDLLQTIVSLSNDESGCRGDRMKVSDDRADSAAINTARNAPSSNGSGCDEVAPTGVVQRKAAVFLAHKRRHASEGAFFEAAERELGGSIELGEQDIHPDFRNTGIRMYTYNANAVGS